MCQTGSLSKDGVKVIDEEDFGKEVYGAIFEDGTIVFGIRDYIQRLGDGETIIDNPREQIVHGDYGFFDSLFSFLKFNELNATGGEEYKYEGISILKRSRSRDKRLDWQIFNPDGDRPYRCNFNLSQLEELLEMAKEAPEYTSNAY